ncbi:TonB-dependent receptor [Oceanicella sp. SM1341]|uniref:TonB-dependent receptor n=1 Tax=Oceanicella sp. SM1341 TaxID=1548889 RepID=UPI000E4C5A02|nr:TonB-dependent receptor [Oceanicella sp. SM1341]
MKSSPHLAALLSSISVIAATAAGAQTAPEDEEFALEPIVIYGDRSTSVADETTSSVAVIDEERLDSPTTETVRDAFRQIANVQAGDWTESGFVIRGINSEGQTPGGLGAPLASFYIDGVQQTVEGTRRGLRGTFDTEQLEVYRGPQSTLTGRAALAGAMYLRTRDPIFEEETRAQVTYGENNHRQAGLAYNNFLGDKLAFRIAGEWSKKDNDLNYPSYARFGRYDDITEDEYYSVRGKVLWRPDGTNRTRVLLSGAHYYDNPVPNDIAGPGWSTGAPGYGEDRGDVWGDILPDLYAGLGLSELPAFQDVRKTNVDSWGLEVTHEIDADLTFTSMTGWSRSLTDRHSINDGTPGEFLTTKGKFDQSLMSQELRLNFDNGPLRWVAGFYAAQEDQDSFRDQTLLSVDHSRNTAEIQNLAGFGEISYEVIDDVRLIAGGRVDYIHQEQTAFYSVNGVTTADSSSTYNDTVFIPKLGVEWNFLPDHTLAFVYTEGYRPGGSGVYAADGTQYDYEAEWAQNYELSYRGRFLQGRLGVAANVFYQNWDDQQVEFWADPFDSSTSYITNAGKSESYGAELELSWAATEKLSLYSSVGLLHTEFTDFEVAGTDYSGLEFPGAPNETLSLGFRWGAPLGFFATGNVTYTGSSVSRLEQGVANPVGLDAYTTVDISAGYAWEQFRLTAYATNLFDERYYTYEYGPGAYATLGDRREVGLRLDVAF